MSPRSFERINYMLRPNKNVERKLIIASLRKLYPEFDVSKYRYVGFGSMWFSDFILMHRELGISDLVTIERQLSRRKRVEFNKPFACIVVRMEDAATALGDVLDSKPSIVWLDYDGPLKNAMTGDIETAVGAMSSGGMLIVTVNAMVDQLKRNIVDEDELSAEKYLAHICDDESLIAHKTRLTKNDFPSLAAELIHSRIKSAVLEKKPDCEYVPIWTFHYADEASMVTVGGMIVNIADNSKLKATNLIELPFVTANKLYDIKVPMLTDKEKRALDKLLPCNDAIEVRRLDFELKQSEVDAYQKFYLEYPVFNEIMS